MNPIVLAAVVGLAARPVASQPASLEVRWAEGSAALEVLAGPLPASPDSVDAARKRPAEPADDQMRRASSGPGARSIIQRFLRSLGKGRFGFGRAGPEESAGGRAEVAPDGTAPACGRPDPARTPPGPDPVLHELGFYRPLLTDETEQVADSTSRSRAADESRRPGAGAARAGGEPCAPQDDLPRAAPEQPGAQP